MTLRRLLASVLLLAFALRAFGLDADPPANLTWSLSPFTDEGFMVQNAKTKLLFGAWLLDDFFRMAVSALFTLIEFLNFRVFGYGFVQARLISVLFGMGSVTLAFFLLRRERSDLAGIFGSSLFATSYLFTMQNRLALEESAMLFFVLVSLWLATGPKPRAWQFFCAGLAAAAAAFFLKLTGLFLLPALFAELLRQRFFVPESRLRALGSRPLLLAALGVGTGFLAWVFFVMVPFGHPAWLMVDANTIHSPGGKPNGALALLRGLFTLGTGDRLVMRQPGVFLLAGLGLLSFLGAFSQKLREPKSLEFLLAALTGSAVLMLISTNYRPLRYQMIVLLPAMLWAALVAERLWQQGFESLRWSRRVALALAPIVAVMSYTVLHAAYWFVRNPDKPPSFGALVWQAIAFTAVLYIAGAWLVQRGRGPSTWSLWRVRGFVVVVLAIGVAFDFGQYGAWWANRRYDLITLSRDLRRLPAGSLIAGPLSSSATMETPHRALPMQEYLHVDHPLERFPVTHLVILENSWEERFFRKSYPALLSRAELVRTYPLAGRRVFLFALEKR